MPTIAVELTTERLRLRQLHPADAPAIAEQVNDWEVVRYTTSIPFPYDRGMAENFIASQQKRWQAWSGTSIPAEEVAFVIERNSDRRLIGCIGLQPAESGGGLEFGYWLGKRYWGEGYATEALGRLVRFAFLDLDLPEIWGAAVPTNDASHRVMEKNGFVIVAAGERPSEVRGHPLPVIIRKLTRAQWASAQSTVA
jgi:RimJ/RimL family protein N-acetyltransferase